MMQWDLNNSVVKFRHSRHECYHGEGVSMVLMRL